ncbi:MAG: phosphoribosylanthranilate isomerase [Clostridia bacterium]|nr:phosphoribosylanthranilate isomerase [Clostridia bacterium]
MEDIAAVNSVLPDFAGFVFAPSRRRVDIETAIMLKSKLDPRITAVGVFVNERINTIAQMRKTGIIDLVQLHGDEDDVYIRRLKEICGCCLIKATGVGDTLPQLPDEADYVLFDTLSEQRGGTGKPFGWGVLEKYCGPPYFLAGGLTLENVSDALDLLSPFCVDVSSGVETNGAKDAKKIERFVNTVRRRSNE